MADDVKAQAAEIERREAANMNRGNVIEGSAEPVEPRTLDSILTVRVDHWTTAALRGRASRCGLSLSEAIREAFALWLTNGEQMSRNATVYTADVHDG